MRRRLFAWVALAFCLAPAAPQARDVDPSGNWPFEASDLPVDPAFTFGQLENGVRYIIRRNDTPENQALVRLHVQAGSLHENADERGFAHLVEHMAFKGSTRVPAGEMVRLLEREGLAFGADTNARTSYEDTIFRLDLPRAEPALLDTALLLMREAASALEFDPEAVEREKQVVLAERRTRDTYAFRNTQDRLEFLYPEARFHTRMPIGTSEAIATADPDRLRRFWQRTYVPSAVTLIIVGAFDPSLVEERLVAHFGDWVGSKAPAKPPAGPISPDAKGRTDIYVDPALNERVTLSQHDSRLKERDSSRARHLSLERLIGHRIINRRFLSLARSDTPPFRGAAIDTADIFDAGRTTTLRIDSSAGTWRRGMNAAIAEYRKALSFGFSQAEVDEQLAIVRADLRDAAAGSETRRNSVHLAAALEFLEDGRIPTAPAADLTRFEGFASSVTPASVLQTLLDEMVPFDDPLIRFEGPAPPQGGAEMLRAAWDEASSVKLEPPQPRELETFAYQDFGSPGEIVADEVGALGIRTLVFANGVRLNLKRTDIEKDRIAVEMNIEGGRLLNTLDAPLRTAMIPVLHYGGLGEHDYDALQTATAGRRVNFRMRNDDDTFRVSERTTPRDLELQLQLMAAFLKDPGYRKQGDAQFRRDTSIFFARRNATPVRALSTHIGEILSDGDPRFSIHPRQAYRELNLSKLRAEVGETLTTGAVEIGLVGDFDEDRAIELVAATLGALPARRSEFPRHAEARRPFTTSRETRVLYHEGKADQALFRFTWLTSDSRDAVIDWQLELLERIVRLRLLEVLRGELGQTYTPAVNASQSEAYVGYGTFNIAAQTSTEQLDDVRRAALGAIQSLVEGPIPDDLLTRARQPMLEALANSLSTLNGWMNLVDRAQSQPEKISRFLAARDILQRITPDELNRAARRFLKPEEAVQIIVLPKDAQFQSDTSQSSTSADEVPQRELPTRPQGE